MSSATNYYAFCADYSDTATCLFAIQQLSDGGAFAAYPDLQRMLRVFQQDSLQKLYVRTINILEILDGYEGISYVYLPGDFDEADFYSKDFDIGYLLGDFDPGDFSDIDFDTGFLDTTNTSFSSLFQTILNMFAEFKRQLGSISEADKSGLDTALVTVLNAIAAIKAYLDGIGMDPCLPARMVYLNNSPDIYVQAAGSDGTDGVAAGIHLRWSFAGDLGLNHLPKGDSDSTGSLTVPFNQANDYVQVSRTPYTVPVSFIVDLQQNAPVVSNAAQQWSYVINQLVGEVSLSNQITLNFTDSVKYNQLAATVDPTVDYFNFIKAYNGVIQVQVINKSLYRIDVDFVNPGVSGDAILKMEAQCIADVGNVEAESVLARKTISTTPGTTIPVTLFAENIQSVSLKMSSGSFIQTIAFETYHDFLTTRNDTDWTAIGTGFSLSQVKDDVYARLETTDYPIDDLWPQYNEGTKVKVANYKDKWAVDYADQPSIFSVVASYLSLSKTDSRALMELSNSDAGPDDPTLEVSLVDMLNLAASDYHIARMLGLGCIDVITGSAESETYIYRITYVNQTSITDSSLLSRFYMTLPTAMSDSMLPLQPVMRPVSYGLPMVSDSVSSAFDANGYATMNNSRAVNIGRALFNDELIGYDFFADLTQEDNTNIFVNSRPVYYGIKYRSATESAYEKPGITADLNAVPLYYAYDSDFPDGVLETAPVPDNETSLFIHFERYAGVHYYAIYGINWFSRSSIISTEVATDTTAFPLKNTLQPPTDVAVQYVQLEDPLLFTTSEEQGWLAGRNASFPGDDTCFTRVVFNWLDIIDISALPDTKIPELSTVIRPDKANVWFLPGTPLIIGGAIKNILPVSGQDTQLQILTWPYQQIDGSAITPVLDAPDFFRFTNSLFSSPEGQFRVVSVSGGTTGPVITIEKNLQNTALEDDSSAGNYGVVQAYNAPTVGSQFSMVENLSNAANWQPVAEGISLYSFADIENAVIESNIDSEGNVTQNWIGGLNEGAIVTPMFSDADLPTDLPGCYQVAFATALAPNPQVNLPFDPANPDANSPQVLNGAHVEWYKGWLRIAPIASGEDKKLLEVFRIVQQDPLILIIYDPDYQTDPITTSADDTQQVPVNYHPGYRAYLMTEPSPKLLNQANIMPQDGSLSRKTMIGLQTADSRPGGSGFTSPVSLPAVLLGRLIIEPVQPELPVASSLVVRPNAIGRAAFTYDIKIAPDADGSARSPFAFKFCRTTQEDVLDVLYDPATITDILAALAGLTTDDNYNQRYFELVNLIFDPASPGNFRVFDAEPQPYGFPVPDKAGLTDPIKDTLDIKIQKYTIAVQGTILPLTAQTPILTFIKTGQQTTNNQPVIRDINGNLLDPSDPAFDPFPMIRQYTVSGQANTTYVRFTDYTLYAASRKLYFYAAAEVTNQLIAGPLSLFAGPVTILNTTPAEEPIVQNYAIIASDTGAISPISVTFNIAPTAVYDNISSMRLYRTTDLTQTNSLLTMGMPVIIDVSDDEGIGYTLTDTFADMATIPFGDLLYYRIAAVRTIINEFNLPEDVISIGSAVVTINMIDTVNPANTQLTYNAADNSLSWDTIVNKGTYYLYQQNSSGNWTLLYTDQTAPVGVTVTYVLPSPLVTTDSNGNPVYNNFKVRIQNSSGLFNLTDNFITI